MVGPVIVVLEPVLAAAAEYAVSALSGVLIGIGIMDDESTSVESTTIPATGRDIEADIEGGKQKAKERIEKITATGALSQAKSKCEQCPADSGGPINETADTTSLNTLYQIKITEFPFGPGWVQTWLFATISFDGYQRAGCLLQEAKGAYDQFFISNKQVKKWWGGVSEMVNQAVVQNTIVDATSPNRLNWYFMEPLSYSFFSRLFMSLGLTMGIFHIPY